MIQTSYTDADGVRRRSPKRAVDAVRELLGPARDSHVVVAWDGAPTAVPDGSHTLALEDGEEIAWRGDRTPPVRLGYHVLDEERHLIAAPRKAPRPDPTSWGVFLPLYALRTARSPVLADLTDLKTLTETYGLVGTLPLFATFDDDPSPYSPVSRLFWNEAYLDVGRLDGPDDDYVDWPNVLERKREMIPVRTPPESWLASHPHAEDYARFRAKEGGSPELHLAAQYMLDEQLRGIGSLYLDFPVGVHPRGYDVSAFDIFMPGVSVGAPPDGFFRGGQNWGFPPVHPGKSAEHGHAYFRECVATAMRVAKILRIDHVMGLHRLFLIPDGFDATDGVYVRYPAGEYYAILTLEATRNECAVVGEDLGTVPRGVRSAMREHGLLRSYVYLFDPDGAIPRDALATLDTHDTATFAAWGERELHPALQKLASSTAEVVVVNLEDLWAERRPQNVPGDSSGPNWRRKAARTFESFCADGVVNTVLAEIDELRRVS